MSRAADWRQRQQGRNPERSFIVQAPAGSGKTELLTQRMLGLLARVDHPEEVVAITFTRKAAAEMAHRLFNRLLQAHEHPRAENLQPHLHVSHELALEVLKNDSRQGWRLLEQPSRLRIRTIDSLCSDLARQLPILSGLDAGHQVAEDPAPLYLQAATRAMAAIEDESDDRQSDVARVLDRYDNQYDRLIELLTSMLAQREQWLEHLLQLRQGEGFDRASLEATLRFLVEGELAEAAAMLPADLLQGLAPVLEYALENEPADAGPLQALLDSCAHADGSICLPAHAEALPHWLTLVRRLLTSDGKNWRTQLNKAAGFPPPSGASGEEQTRRQHWKDSFAERLASLRENETLRARLETLLRLPKPEYDDESWASLESLLRIMLRAYQEWHLVMAESGRADFSEIASRALLALGSGEQPSELALRLDYRIRHLLVDEFQDTSHNQIRLLQRLTAGWVAGDGRTLFLVGDPMQSIYRFRKAEVSLFIEAFEGRLFSQLALEPLQLEVNFRSSAGVVEWVNRVFPAVMPARNDPVKGAVTYSPAVPRPDAQTQGAIEVCLGCIKDDQAEADQVVQIIRDTDPVEATAILVRSRRHAHAILAHLDALKQSDERFRYRAVQFNPLAETPLIRDLVSLTVALQQPADQLAWLALMRAPFIGLTLADLERLTGDGDGCLLASALLDPLAGSEADLSADGASRLARVAPILQRAARLRGRAPVREVVESAWQHLGGPACLGHEAELNDAATYFDLLDRLEQEGLPLDRDTLDQHLEDLWAEPDARAHGHLQVMTIYAAKGLQFDTVIVPGLNKDTGGDGQKLMHWFELAESERIVLSPMRNVDEKESARRSGDLVKFISGVERQRQKLENGRLLYVAATRAVHSLYLLGAVEANRGGAFTPRPTTLLGELWPAIGNDQEPILQQQLAALDDPTARSGSAEDTGVAQVHRRLAADWRTPQPPTAHVREPAELTETPEYVEFSWAGEDARLAGNLVHRLLQHIAEEGAARWRQEGGMGGREDWCRQQLRRDGVHGSMADRIIDRTTQAVERCLASDRGRWILADHTEAACEYPVTAILDGRPSNLVLDRTFVEDGTRWIIDYKTSSHAGGDLDTFLANEQERYRSQLRRYRKALEMTEDRTVRTALYFPLLDRLVEVD